MAKLRELGEVEDHPGSKTEDQAIQLLKGADVAIADMWESPLNAKLLSNIPSVKFITINSTGFDRVDLQAAKENGVLVANTPNFGTQAVAEHVIAFILALAHHVVDSNNAMQEQPFEYDPGVKEHWRFHGTDISGKTLGIIGLGNIGTRVAELGNALGMKVIAHNRSPKDVSGVQMVSLEQLFKKSDFVSINAALTKDQEDLIDERTLALMKPSAYLINTARGGFVNDEAVAKAIKNQHLAGAGLDFMNDWSKDNPLVGLDNVILNPHIGAFTKEAYANLANIIVDNVEAFVKGQPINIIT